MDTDGTWWLVDYDLDEILDTGYWTTKDGKRLQIKDMETSHIKNCINYILKSYEIKNKNELDEDDYIKYKIEEFEDELKERENK
jgi:hypothetical protein